MIDALNQPCKYCGITYRAGHFPQDCRDALKKDVDTLRRLRLMDAEVVAERQEAIKARDEALLDLDDCRKDEVALEAAFDALKVERDELLRKVEALQQEVARLEGEVLDADSRLGDKCGALRNAQSERDELFRQTEILQASLLKAHEERQEALTETGHWAGKHQEVLARNLHLVDDLNVKEEEIDRLRGCAQTLMNDLDRRFVEARKAAESE